MMKKPPTNLIALCARGRGIGYVITVNGSIYRYGVKSIRGKLHNSPALFDQVAHAFLKLLDLMGNEGVIVIERLDAKQRYGALARNVAHTIAHFASPMYSFEEITLTEAKQLLCGRKEATIADLVATVQCNYPVFRPLIEAKKSHIPSN